jgi:hypothetical protein
MKKATKILSFAVILLSFITVSAQNTATTSGNWDDCATWGNPSSIIQNITDTKTINNGITVAQNTAWSTNNIIFIGNGAVTFASSTNAVDFVTDLGDDKTCANPIISTLTCSSGTTTGALTSNVAASGVSRTVSYSGGNGSIYPAGSPIASTGVTGLVATLRAGTLTTSTGSLIFDITGTPSTFGTASFTINFAGKSCSFSIGVAAVIIFDQNDSNCTFNAANGWAFTGNWTGRTGFEGGPGSCWIQGDAVNNSSVGTGMAYKTFATTIGRKYTVTIGGFQNGIVNVYDIATVYAGSATSGTALGTVNITATTTYTITFVATATSSTIKFVEAGSSSYNSDIYVTSVKVSS